MPKGKEFGPLHSSQCIILRYFRLHKLLRSVHLDMEKGCLCSISNGARSSDSEWGLSDECNPHHTSCAVWLFSPGRTELECFSSIKEVDIQKEENQIFLCKALIGLQFLLHKEEN